MRSPTIISIQNLSKTYASGTKALDDISLDIREGEIFSLLGPNGAGKTTLIGIITGIVNKTSGDVHVLEKDIIEDYRFTRSMIGLVPQEIQLDIFLSVEQTFKFQRGFFGKPHDGKLLERTLKDLSLWEKRKDMVGALSGGMKRRVLIGKALMNEPRILFLDEPTAGVDVELRKGMWELVAELKKQGVTIILTTHYLEEAQKMADRIGVINNGKLILIDDTKNIMQKFGAKHIIFHLSRPLSSIPQELTSYSLELSRDKKTIYYTKKKSDSIVKIMHILEKQDVAVSDIETKERSLEDIFINLIGNDQT